VTPDVSVVMLSLDHWPYTAAALSGLAGTARVPFETVVVDNGSAPEVVAALQATAGGELGRRLRLRCRLNPTNAGVASGRNQGAAMCAAPLVLFLDNDVEIVDPRWLHTLVETYRANPALGAVGAVLHNADADRTIQFSGGAVDRRGRVRFDTSLDPDPDLCGHARATHFCIGACLLTPRASFEGAGGFDPAFDPMDYEDLDYCLRLAEAGHRSAIALGARLVHHGHVTTGGHDPARVRNYVVNGRRFLGRWADRLPEPALGGC
jgi:O-antigen biosynthesis protein